MWAAATTINHSLGSQLVLAAHLFEETVMKAVRKKNRVACLEGTNISVYHVVDLLTNDGLEALLDYYPNLTQEDIDTATLYVKQRKELFEQNLEKQKGV